jgi:hypothetical protein
MTTVNITTFAFNLSTMTRKTLEASTPFHTCYVEADNAGQKQLRSEWMLGYIMGSIDCDAAKAERILSKGKGAGANTEHVKAIDRATSDFRYHVVRALKADITRDEIGVPKHIQEMADALAKACAEYEGARKLCNTAVAKSFAKA